MSSHPSLPFALRVKLALDHADLERLLAGGAPPDEYKYIGKDVADALVTATSPSDCEQILRRASALHYGLSAMSLSRPANLVDLSVMLWDLCCEEANKHKITPGLRALLISEENASIVPRNYVSFNSSMTIFLHRRGKDSLLLAATGCRKLHVDFFPESADKVEISVDECGAIDLSIASGSFSLQCDKLFVAPLDDN